MADKVKHAQELFARLSVGDTRGYGGAQFMARDIREELKETGKDLSALDPTGKKSDAEMEQALNAVTVAERVKHAQELFARLSVGDTRGYGGAQFMARDIREELKEAGKDLSALDPTGKKSAAEREQALNLVTAAERVKHAQELFARLSVGDTRGYGGAQFMAPDIREELKEAGRDLFALDPDGKKSVSKMEQALNAAADPERVRLLSARWYRSNTAPPTKNLLHWARDLANPFSGATKASGPAENISKPQVQVPTTDPTTKTVGHSSARKPPS